MAEYLMTCNDWKYDCLPMAENMVDLQYMNVWLTCSAWMNIWLTSNFLKHEWLTMAEKYDWFPMDEKYDWIAMAQNMIDL